MSLDTTKEGGVGNANTVNTDAIFDDNFSDEIFDSVKISNKDKSRELSTLYQIVRQHGKGGAAVVYEGIRLSDSRRVAIKVLSVRADADDESANEAQILFFREARLIASIQEPHVVECMDYGLFNGKPCLIMEFLDGIGLNELITECGALSFEVSIEIAKQLLSAVESIHETGIIHRDIKPQNIMVIHRNDPPEIRVYDFGIASCLVRMENDSFRTRIGTVRGTPAYMAPELFSGKVRASRESDIYSVGLILFECLTGSVAVSGTSLMQIAFKHVHEDIEIPCYIPQCLAQIISRCCDKSVGRRYHHAREVIKALDEAREQALAEREQCEIEYLDNIKSKKKSTRDFEAIDFEVKKKPARRLEIFLVAIIILLIAAVGFLAFRSLSSDNAAPSNDQAMPAKPFEQPQDPTVSIPNPPQTQAPAAVQPDPAAVQPDPAAVQPDPAAVQPDPAAVQPDPAAVQPDPDMTKPAPGISPDGINSGIVGENPTVPGIIEKKEADELKTPNRGADPPKKRVTPKSSQTSPSQTSRPSNSNGREDDTYIPRNLI